MNAPHDVVSGISLPLGQLIPLWLLILAPFVLLAIYFAGIVAMSGAMRHYRYRQRGIHRRVRVAWYLLTGSLFALACFLVAALLL